MACDYDAIRKDNIRRRGEEFADIGNFLAQKLYGDRSHFIYELLQNTEDALALRRQNEPDGCFSGDVRFMLCKDHLEVSHSGKLFDEEDVRAICDVLRGTKNERRDQIGTFGIGFKSVYAFTASPEIHSGDEHFVIEQYIRPREVPPRKQDNPTQTLFYFPFDHPNFNAADAFDLIKGKLKSLGPRSLLFLHHVRNLQWIIEGAGKGFYMRETQPSNNGGSFVEIIGEGTGQTDIEEAWLVICRDVQHPTSMDKLPVKMAYSIKTSSEGKAIQPLSRSPLTVYFPTAKETGLAFLIHGPFASTPARDNIQTDCTWNNLLLSELANLVADSLTICQKHDLLTAEFIATLPIDETLFPVDSPFRRLFEAVLQALKTQPLIPTADGRYARAQDLVLGRAQDLRDLLPPELLRELLGQNSTVLGWVDSTITESRLPKVWQYLRDKCNVQVIEGETFSRQVTLRFFEARDDDWMVRFYSFLNGQEALWRAKGVYNYPPEGPLRRKAIIRCEDAQHRSPFDDWGHPAVFLPIESDTDCHVVSRSICRHVKAVEFFTKLGLIPPDICTTVLRSIIPLYDECKTVEEAAHAKHLEIIRSAMTLKDSPRYYEMVETLRVTPWVMAYNAANTEVSYCKPNTLFFPSHNLKVLFEGNKDVWFLEEQEEGIQWEHLGVRTAPIIKCDGLHAKNPGFITLASYHGFHKRGVDGFDPDTKIEGLELALNKINIHKAAYIWNDLIPPLIRFLHGRYQTATHQNFDNAFTNETDSDLGKMLKTKPWIPIGNGEFKRPGECTAADLSGELTRNRQLAQVLGLLPDPESVSKEAQQTQETLVTEAGFPPEVAALLVKNKEALTPKIINAIIAAHAATDTELTEFPERSVPNPERRTSGIINRTRNADLKTYDHRKRSVRTSAPQIDPKVWLREMYTNRQGITICQICCKAMPFRLPSSGHYHFEAVQVADHFSKEDHCLYLALCPLCSAKYTFLVKNVENALSAFIWAIENDNANDFAVPVQMDGITARVRFVEAHLLDLKTALTECLS